MLSVLGSAGAAICLAPSRFTEERAQQAADPGRMRPNFQRDPAARHRAKDFLQRFRIRAHALLQLYLAGFVQHAVPAVAIS